MTNEPLIAPGNGVFKQQLNDMKASGIANVQREMGDTLMHWHVARQFPRNWEKVEHDVVRAFSIRTLAAKAQYKYPRGNQEIVGKSVVTARAIAPIWGNVSYGCKVLDATEDQITLRGFCVDYETNSEKIADDVVKMLIQRKDKRSGRTEWVKPDERDARELISRRGAFLERNAILITIPDWVSDLAVETANRTLTEVARKDLQRDPKVQIQNVIETFARFGVSAEQLETKLGHPLDRVSPEELADLRNVAISFREGEMVPSDWIEPEPTKTRADELNAQMEAKK